MGLKLLEMDDLRRVQPDERVEGGKELLIFHVRGGGNVPGAEVGWAGQCIFLGVS